MRIHALVVAAAIMALFARRGVAQAESIRQLGTLERVSTDSLGSVATVFIDIASLSMIVIDPAGKLGRVMAIPRPDEAQHLIGSAFGLPGFDARRPVYDIANRRVHLERARVR